MLPRGRNATTKTSSVNDVVFAAFSSRCNES